MWETSKAACPAVEILDIESLDVKLCAVRLRDFLGLGRTAVEVARLDNRSQRHDFGILVPPEMLEAMTGSASIAPRISRDEALQVPAVMRARNLIAGTLASLPHVIHGPDKREVPDTYLLDGNIDPDLPNSVMFAMTYEDLLFEGVAWWRVTRFGWHNYPVEARHVPVDSVHIAQTGGLLPSQTRILTDQPFPAVGRIYIDGIPVPDEEIIRFDSPQPPLLRHAARAIRSALKLDQIAATYADDPLPLGYFTPKEGADNPTDDEINKILDDWQEARSRRAWGFVNDALDANTLQWSPEQLQLAAARQHAVLEIARASGLDAEDLGVSVTSRTYANQEQRWQALINTTLGAYISAMQDRLSMRDILPRNYIAKVKLDALLRGDTLTRMQTYEIGLRVGAITQDEIRDLEDRPALTGSQRAAATPPQPSPPPMPAEPQPAVPADQEGRPVPRELTFDTKTEPVVVSFEGGDAAQFRVDPQRRTVSGVIVPWNVVADNGFAKWRFAPDSLHWSAPSRVKLNTNHDRGDLIGRATRLTPLDEGLDATFGLGRSDAASKALDDAQDEILDGFSIEIEFREEFGDEWQPDPSDESVRLVRRATLTGTALTGSPAFDDARVASVKASRHSQKGSSGMAPNAGTKTNTRSVAGSDGGESGEGFDFEAYAEGLGKAMLAAHKELTEGLAESIGDSISAGFKTALETLPNPQDGPMPVRAARYGVIREPAVYRFNGVSGGPSLVRDAWYASREHDDEAIERLRKYRLQTEDMAKLAQEHLSSRLAQQFVPQSTSTASQIIPPGYRPDLYVPQLQQGRPIVGAASRGVIGNAAPFVVPVFGSATGATADHVEGTNPSDGSLTFTTKTVTPGAVSGRLTLTRELVDSGNPAIDAIAVFAMNESYARQTEAKVYTLLNGTNGAGGTITSGFVPSGAQAATFASTGGTPFAEAALVKGMRQRLAIYPFNRFASPSLALMGSNATSIIAGAMDSTGRPIFPSVGATNTSGLGNAYTQGWSVDGLPHIPAWAITGVASTDTQIFTVNQGDLWVWESPLLTFRFEEKQGPANIELNVFGYFATALIRPVGLSGIRIT